MDNVPQSIQKLRRVTKKAVRNYEVIAVVNVGKLTTVAVAVVEDGHATYALGNLSQAQLRAHFSKIDLVIGTYLREYEQLRTETLMEEMAHSGIETDGIPDRYYQDELSLRVPTKLETVEVTLRKYLKARGFTIQKNNSVLHVRHLERMRHRTGYIVPKVGIDDTTIFTR